MSTSKPRRVTRDDDPELQVDYVTAKIRHLGVDSDHRICSFSLHAAPLRSHYLTLLPELASELKGVALKRYLFEHMATAFHTGTCENVR